MTRAKKPAEPAVSAAAHDPEHRPGSWPFPRRENVQVDAQVEVLSKRTDCHGALIDVWTRAKVVVPPDVLLAITVRYVDGQEQVVDRRHWRMY